MHMRSWGLVDGVVQVRRTSAVRRAPDWGPSCGSAASQESWSLLGMSSASPVLGTHLSGQPQHVIPLVPPVFQEGRTFGLKCHYILIQMGLVQMPATEWWSGV